jgi:nucleotide-binding universal stress UspA family protein
MFRNILVGLDVDRTAQYAFDDALVLAQATAAHLRLLHVFSSDAAYELCQPLLYAALHQQEQDPLAELPDRDPVVESMISRSLGHEAQQLECLLGCLNVAKKAGVKTAIDLRRGKAGPVLCEVANQEPTDLIVVGHRGTHREAGVGWGNLEFGSVSHYVVHHAPCPVLIAHRYLQDGTMRGALTGLKCLLVPVDDSAMSQPICREALDLATATGASLTLLHVIPAGAPSPRLPMLPSLQEQAQTRGVALQLKQVRVDNGQSIAETISQFAQAYPFNLILMGRRRLAKVQEWVLGSVSHAVANQAPCTVLLVPLPL